MTNKQIDQRENELLAQLDGSPMTAAYDELLESAFEAVMLHPGSDFNSWRDILLSQYRTDVVDAFGTDMAKANAGIISLWQTTYHDPASGENRTISQWAERFSTAADVQSFYDQIKP